MMQGKNSGFDHLVERLTAHNPNFKANMPMPMSNEPLQHKISQNYGLMMPPVVGLMAIYQIQAMVLTTEQLFNY
eukprot:SAG31_NODE_191_length_20809_cov_64.613761_4_plen_74_part_00